MRSEGPSATSETRQSAPPRLEEARTAATPPIHDLPPPRNVVPLPRPRTREERYGTDLSGPRETLTTGLVSHTEFIDRKGDEA
jgi:hypothetical protein